MDTVDNSKRMAQSGQMLLTDGSSTLTTLKGGNSASSGMSGILSSLTNQNSSTPVTPATGGLGGLFSSLSSLTGAPSTGTGSLVSTISQLFPLSGSTTDVYSLLTQENLPGKATSLQLYLSLGEARSYIFYFEYEPPLLFLMNVKHEAQNYQRTLCGALDL